MAEICVVYVTEDEAITRRLVACLRKHWSVWWAQDLAHGDWDQAVRKEISSSAAVVPVLSQHVQGDRTAVIKDEMRYAQKQQKPIFPFLIGPADVPLGLGDLTHTEALGWSGEEGHQGYQKLRTKIAATIGNGRPAPKGIERPRELRVREKRLSLPAFVFSLSSHETQIRPREGATLLRLLEPAAALVSAYDVWKYRKDSATPTLRSSVEELKQSDTVLFLDSGNYEAYRKRDHYSRGNPNGWTVDLFRRIAAGVSPDVAFSFDTVRPKGKPGPIADRIVAAFGDDQGALGDAFPIIPIVHLPSTDDRPDSRYAPEMVSRVANATNPIMVAIPERELGDGLLERARTVRAIRKALNALGRYYPLHLLGTGNPISMIALAAAGADGFDGLEWCRTVADYSTGFLFHFQHFDLFSQTRLHHVQDPKIRILIENPVVPYTMKALSYNVDFFRDSMQTMQKMIHSGQAETLLKTLPGIGPALSRELSA